MRSTRLLPIWLDLEQRRAVVVGGGPVAWQKVRALLPTGAAITAIAPEACAGLRRAATRGELVWEPRAYSPEDLEGAAIVFGATNDPAVNREVVAQARGRGILANAVDDPACCDFYAASTLRRGAVAISLHTEGRFPGLAKALREVLDAWLPGRDDAVMGSLVALRGALRNARHPPGVRSRALKRLIAEFKHEYLDPETLRR